MYKEIPRRTRIIAQTAFWRSSFPTLGPITSNFSSSTPPNPDFKEDKKL
jgi:hypothetical protein